MRPFRPTELAAMALAVVFAAVMVFATAGSARSSELTFCRVVHGEVVGGVTTDCAAAVPIDELVLRPPAVVRG